MRLLTILLTWAGAVHLLSAQTFQQISTGAGYLRQSYVNLASGTEKQVLNTAWDIAFTVYGQQDGGIFINESAGSSMGQPQAAVELYDARPELEGERLIQQGDDSSLPLYYDVGA